jgi:V8-like Glu-specific endopeptidase
MTKNITKLLSLTAVLSITALTHAANQEQRIVYGIDNRVEVYQSTKIQKILASSTAGMVQTVKTVNTGSYTMLPPASISKEMGLCKDEKFSEQPSSVICSGFLVAPDILVTAGHCVTNQERCDEVSWVFDYKVDSVTKRADMLVPNTNIYKCSKVIESKLEGEGKSSRDFAVIKLDRKVKDRTPLNFRKIGKVSTEARLTVIGHPSGLPSKVTTGGKIFNNTYDTNFVTNLDTFGGNSGSAVFNSATGEVEGILVRGAKDYIGDNGCARVNNVIEDITGIVTLGESVSRITDIETLQNMDLFQQAQK